MSLHHRVEHIVEIYYDVPYPNEEKVMAFACRQDIWATDLPPGHSLEKEVAVVHHLSGPCSYPMIEITGEDADKVIDIAKKIERFIKRFKGHRFDP